MKMKELEERTGIGRETIRFYIREGLLPEPEKPQRNVAIYSQDHINRIQIIKKLQDERFLPLGVIKTVLDHPSVYQEDNPSLAGLEFLLAARLGANSSEKQSVAELIEATSLTEEEFNVLIKDGLVEIVRHGGVDCLEGQDIQIARIWGEIKDAGFDPLQGYDEGDVNRYVAAAEMLAEQEVEHFYERVPPSQSTDDAAALAETGIALVEQLFSILHGKAILRRIAERSSANVKNSK
jgi:DNA-binding transcriptional MerR regulator